MEDHHGEKSLTQGVNPCRQLGFPAGSYDLLITCSTFDVFCFLLVTVLARWSFGVLFSTHPQSPIEAVINSMKLLPIFPVTINHPSSRLL